VTPVRTFEYRHRVAFEETNLVGNVYYVNLLRWQGRCRELFLMEHCPELLPELARGLVMVTTRCSCEFLRELVAFDEVAVRMRLAERAQNRVTMGFEYWRLGTGDGGAEPFSRGEELVARGEQQVAFLRREGGRLVTVPIPAALSSALDGYAEDEVDLRKTGGARWASA